MEFNYRDFSKTMLGVATGLGLTISKEQIDIYFSVFKTEFATIEQFKKVAMQILKEWNYSYLPKPAHFIAKTKLSEDELDVVARKSWGDVREAVRAGAGYTKQAIFSDELTEYAVNAILPNGMAGFMDKTYDDLKWLEKDFIKIFKAGYASGRVASLKPNKTVLLEDTLGNYVIPPAISNDSVKVLEAPKQNKASDRITALTNRAIQKI